MPELPEVETTRRGIAPHIQNHKVTGLRVRQRRLRWPVPVARLQTKLVGFTLERVERRAKYLLLRNENGTAILHLGMSGSLCVVPADQAPGKHDHVDILLDSGQALRLTDPRRFGALLWTAGPPEEHELLRSLGPEPLGEDFDGDYLWRRSRNRKVAVKSYIMDAKTVAGVGNIYANEALFMAGIHPARAAGRISRERYRKLADAIRQVLESSIAQGGTTLRDFVNSEGKPGYFAVQLQVYDRDGEPCPVCGTTLKGMRQGQRATVYCPHCQR